MKLRTLKVRRLVIVLAGLVLVPVIILVAFPFSLLCVTSPLQSADAIVVLGGEPGARAKHAATLVTNGLAPRVFVSGLGDCQTMRDVLIKHGVRTNLIELECDARTTQENALFTVQWLRAQKCRRVVLVTSWFHSRRALSSFRKYAPEIEFLSAPVPKTEPWQFERGQIASEYLKTLAYALRYGIWPTVSS